MSWFGKVINFFKTAISKVSELLVAVLGATAAQQLGDATIEALKSELGVIVKAIVAEVAAIGLGGDAARSEAIKRIIAAAEAKGIEYSKSLINLLLELAVQHFKGNITEA